MKARPAQRCAAIAASKTPVARREPERKLSLLRTICISAVERMTESKLRALVLPLGYVIDILEK
jgi:hypothetical protein